MGEEEVIMQEGLHTEGGGGMSSREGGGSPEGRSLRPGVSAVFTGELSLAEGGIKPALPPEMVRPTCGDSGPSHPSRATFH